MNKKALGFLLILGLTAIVSACAGGGDTTAPAEESPAEVAPAESPAP